MDAMSREEGIPSSSAERIAAARNALAQSIALAGLQRDPMRPVLDALSQTLDAMEAAANDVRSSASSAASPASPISPEAERKLVDRLAQAAAAGANRHTMELAQAHNWRTVLIAAGVLAITTMAALTGGVWWGASLPVQTNLGQLPREVVQMLAANDMRKAIAECKPLGPQQNGKRACAVNVWLEP